MNQSFTVIYFTITRRESLEEVYDDKIYGPESVLFKAGSKMQVLRGRVLTISVYPPQLEGLVMSPAYIAASLMRALCKVIRPTKYLMGYFSRRQEVSGTISDWIVRGIQGVIPYCP